jgi:putative glutamine amidotransferase
VCYGAQLLNVHYGGTLYQDIISERGSALRHGSSSRPATHEVTFMHDFLGFPKDYTVMTTHRHHQAVHKLAKGFQVTARTADGVIEAIAGHGHYGIQ